MSPSKCLLIGLIMIAATIGILLAMGRMPICECGYVLFWTPTDDVSGTSQHIADWYTPSHIIHGFLFYWFFWLVLRKRPVGERALGAIFIEAAWEIVENSPWIINRYREETMAVGYAGDSVLNSTFDIWWMLVGFFFAWRMPVWLTILAAIAFELLALWVIRDNLTLNVLMLTYPLDAVKAWQGG
ncbi:DUF2585 domain-containing protein [Roseibium salinum]|uniref:DUF2585 domain-containing protein n=1 Tax=Roseibium salinum TaxID=1604349 RepID=A0ABT3R2X8_9HYPH|nr:DUF2585 domain-containing protein [Roseibium sp. DSM 29163]MCX2723558.1 DUF2585 domain-containing protein [Roseibium sp. DSM 29163]